MPAMLHTRDGNAASDATLVEMSGVATVVPLTFSAETGGDVIVEAGMGQTILEVSLANDIPHAHACGGNARCSTCRFTVTAGQQNLSPRNDVETKLAKRLGFPDDVRLACQTRVGGPARLRRLIRDEEDVSLVRSDSGSRNTTSVGSEVPLAILHAAVRDSAPLMRGQLAHDVVHILNRYYTQVGDAILANGGNFARYDGTTIVAFFGLESGDAKTKCTNAVRAALRMQKRMTLFDAYLAIGEPANITAAVAAANQGHGSRILATEELVNVVESELRLGHVSHQTLRHREVSLYEIHDFVKPDVHDIVQTSFELVAARKEEAAALFYGKLFDIAPQVRPLFAATDMRVQGEMLMNMIAIAVRGLDNLEQLKPALQDGVQVPHYAAIETIVGPSFNLDVKLAWTAIYNFIAETMIEAAA